MEAICAEHQRRRKGLSESGFSLIELFVVMALIGIIAATAVPAFRTFKQRGYDAVAVSDFNHVYKGVYADSAQEDGGSSYFLINRTGPGPLPTPLSEISLSDGSRARFIIKIPIGGVGDIIFFSVLHDSGGHEFRYLEIFGNITKQKIPLS